MRALSLLLIAVAILAIAQPVQASSYEARGSFAVGYPPAVLTGSPNACDLSGKGNGVYSSCFSLGGTSLAGHVAMVRDEGLAARLTQGLRPCFYSSYSTIVDCGAPSDACPDPSWSWCGKIPAGTRVVALTATAGVQVSWHFVVS